MLSAFWKTWQVWHLRIHNPQSRGRTALFFLNVDNMFGRGTNILMSGGRGQTSSSSVLVSDLENKLSKFKNVLDGASSSSIPNNENKNIVVELFQGTFAMITEAQKKSSRVNSCAYLFNFSCARFVDDYFIQAEQSIKNLETQNSNAAKEIKKL